MNVGMQPGLQLNAEAIASQAGRIIVITSSQGFVIPAANFIVELVGGGAGGDSERGTGTVGAAGGASGGYVRKAITGAPVGAVAAAVIGGAGARATGGARPGDGGNSSFILTGFANLAAGGGIAADYQATDYFSVGGTATGGDINIVGQPGSLKFIANQAVDYQGGIGGSTPLGSGGVGNLATSYFAHATGYGAGGGGSRSGAWTTQGNGAPGVCIITILS